MARKLDCVAAVTGATDAVSDGTRTVKIENGHALMSRVTGTGCMCSSVAAAVARKPKSGCSCITTSSAAAMASAADAPAIAILGGLGDCPKYAAAAL
ncbi:MAG: hydroxyethylthiazole kinase [Clostridiales bacterium]|nr:hydroxyethylthiazole kinase [Clostridiales bacterium]